MTAANSYRIISEDTYQKLVNLAKAIANHLEKQEEKGKAVANEFKEIADTAYELDDELNSGLHESHQLPPKLQVGTAATITETPEIGEASQMIMDMAIKAFPGILVVLPAEGTNWGYTVWSLKDAYRLTNFCENYKNQWVLQRKNDQEGSNFWQYQITDKELMKRKKEQIEAIRERPKPQIIGKIAGAASSGRESKRK
jgi:hypothetical protein